MLYAADVRISMVSHPFSGEYIQLGVFSYPITVLWVVGITNAVNLIDGLDGLAAGVAAIAAFAIGLVSIVHDHPFIALLSFTLTGSLIGFLKYNFHPAKIFLGDSGSLLLGFLLALLSMLSSAKGSTAFAIAVPLLALGLPLIDTLLAILRRSLGTLTTRKDDPEAAATILSSITRPDRNHIHHRLLSLGMHHRRAVILLYGISFSLGLGAVAMSFLNELSSRMILIGVGLAAFAAVRRLGYREMALVKSGALLRFFDWPFLYTRTFRVTVDLFFLAISFTAADLLSRGDPSGGLLAFLIATITLQATVFYFCGVYDITLQNPKIADALKIARAAGIAAVCIGLLMVLMDGELTNQVFLAVLLDFFILATLVVSSRFSLSMLSSLHSREETGVRRALIYGAGPDGIAALNLIRDAFSSSIVPLGFLEDDPMLEGKSIDGYPIFGGHWRIQRLMRTQNVREILITDGSVRPEVLRRLRRLSQLNSLSVRTFNVGFAPTAKSHGIGAGDGEAAEISGTSAPEQPHVPVRRILE
jgi:UDP-N-acetylmuramyl pentapeptide phosphotransferase/UDP-N-acetylglucosamine-1-phosphate transferase